MSLKDFRALIDIHGGDYIGIECVDTGYVEIGVNGERQRYDVREALEILHGISHNMITHMNDGFERFAIWIQDQGPISGTYYDGGAILDALSGAIRYALE